MNIPITVHLKYKWFFWPCFYACCAAAGLGANNEKMAGFLVRYCIKTNIK